MKIPIKIEHTLVEFSKRVPDDHTSRGPMHRIGRQNSFGTVPSILSQLPAWRINASQLQHYIAMNVLKQAQEKMSALRTSGSRKIFIYKSFAPGASLRWDELINMHR